MPTLEGRSRRRRAVEASQEPRYLALDLADAYADAIRADEGLRDELCTLALDVDMHLLYRRQPGAWTRIHIPTLAEEIPQRGDERRIRLLRLASMLEWMADERLIPLDRAIDYGVEIERIVAQPDLPTRS